jgi:3-hydroxyacyl-CoA dehydrogenase
MEERILRLDKNIRNAAVIGAGMMGSQIAALVASADIPVLLLDIVPEGVNDRDILAKRAIEQIAAHPSMSIRNSVEHLEAGNIEDHMDRLSEMDWVIECVSEDINIKHSTYQKLSSYIGDNAIVTSNTSSIPLEVLRKGLPHHMRKRMCIAHFFNPPESEPLLELVVDEENNSEDVVRLQRFADQQLGRTVIEVRDTPGFIANRIGIFWLLTAMEEAQKENIAIDAADNLMNGSFGFPKTGVFGLADFIGLNTIPDVVNSMSRNLPKEDELFQLKTGLGLIDARLKADKGFYSDHKLVIDLKDGKYRPIEKIKLNITDWRAFLAEDTAESRFVCRTFVRALNYTAQVASTIAENILQIDAAMRDGYGWEYGPFEIINRLGGDWLVEMIQKQGFTLAPFLKQAMEKKGFYANIPGEGISYLAFDGTYHQPKLGLEKWPLVLKTARKKPILQNNVAQLWDIEDGIACFSITNKMGLIDMEVLDLLEQSLERVEADFSGLIIGHDGKNFSAGMDLSLMAKYAGAQDWKSMEDILRRGQQCFMRIRNSHAPIVAAISGYTLGGGCELAMHCAGAQIHSQTKAGLVETDIGLIPGWGGLSAHLINAVTRGGENVETITQKVMRAFRQVATGYKSSDAEEVVSMEMLSASSRITYNRSRLLPDAKYLCRNISMTRPAHPHKKELNVPVKTLYASLLTEIESMHEREPEMTMHRKLVLQRLAEVLSGRAAMSLYPPQVVSPEGWVTVTEHDLMQTSLDAFMELAREDEVLNKIKTIVGN